MYVWMDVHPDEWMYVRKNVVYVQHVLKNGGMDGYVLMYVTSCVCTYVRMHVCTYLSMYR